MASHSFYEKFVSYSVSDLQTTRKVECSILLLIVYTHNDKTLYMYFQVDGKKYIVENVDSSGNMLEGSAGHLLCPGKRKSENLIKIVGCFCLICRQQ